MAPPLLLVPRTSPLIRWRRWLAPRSLLGAAVLLSLSATATTATTATTSTTSTASTTPSTTPVMAAPVCPVAGTCPVPKAAPVRQVTPVRDRRRVLPEGRDAKVLRAFAKTVRAPGGVLEDVCPEPGPFCAPALAPFFDALDGSAAGGRVEVAVFGNSLIAGDRIVDIIRDRLTEQFGDGGRGFLLADRMAPYGRRDRAAAWARGWRPATVADLHPEPLARAIPFGVAGAMHIAESDDARSRYPVGDHTHATIFGWQPPGRAGLQIRLDNGPWRNVIDLPLDPNSDDAVIAADPATPADSADGADGADDDDRLPAGTDGIVADVADATVADDNPHVDINDNDRDVVLANASNTKLATPGDDTKAQEEQQAFEHFLRRSLRLPPGAKTLDLRGRSGAVAHGVVLEHERGGVIVDTFGVAASDAGYFLEANTPIVIDSLQERKPSLVVMMLGGNETKRVAWGRKDYDQTELEVRALLRRLRGAEQTSCLVVGPIDGVINRDARAGQDPMTPRPQLEPMNERFRTVARSEGCAFFDLYAAMGGRGSLQRFKDRGVLHDDLVHPRGKGLDVLGQLIVDAVISSYRNTPALVPGRNQRGETVMVPVAPVRKSSTTDAPDASTTAAAPTTAPTTTPPTLVRGGTP